VRRRRWTWQRLALRIALGAVAVTVLPVAALRCVPPLTSSFMLERRFLARGERACAAIDYHWVARREISPELAIAVVAAEDQRFSAHAGFDVDSIERALRERRGRGASTISQQVAKNLFLWPGRSLVRKALEAWFTVWIEALWPKQRILEVYLNVAQFGRCTFGAGAASADFFGKRPAALSGAEAALLAAVLPNPVRRRVDAPSPHVRARAARIEREVQRLGGPAFLAEHGL
jgi:monofunctional biosynthetic peptidoglycan transglycosylase